MKANAVTYSSLYPRAYFREGTVRRVVVKTNLVLRRKPATKGRIGTFLVPQRVCEKVPEIPNVRSLGYPTRL